MNAPVPPPVAAVVPPNTANENHIESSESVGELFAALAKAQGEFVTVRKDAENTFCKSNYATLAAIVEMLRKPLAKNGLGFVQMADAAAKTMTTVITHSSGQFIASTIPFTNASVKPQEIGSAITYAKRYGLQAAFGVVVAEDPTDDDGNEANGNMPPKPPKFH